MSARELAMFGGVTGADAVALSAVDGDAHVVRERLGARGSAGRSGVCGDRVVPLCRTGAESL